MTSPHNMTTTLEKKGKDAIREWKQFADELNTQLQLGVSETEKEFEKQKTKLSEWLDSFTESLPSMQEISAESTSRLKSLTQQLRQQTSAAKADTADALKAQQQHIARGLSQLKEEVDRVKQVAGEKTEPYLLKANQQLDHLHTRFDLFRLQMHLGKAESKALWEEKKKNLGREIHKIQAKLDHQQDRAVENWDHFTDEMGTAWKHFKNAMTPVS